MKEKELDKLKEYCNQEFECQGTIKPINWNIQFFFKYITYNVNIIISNLNNN